MKKSQEKEPDLVEYRLEYSLNDDLPSERFFMATDPRDALSQLAYSCIKFIPVENLSEEEQDSFAKAFSNPNSPFKEKPQLFNVPEPIPDIDFPEPEPVKEVEIDEQAKGGEDGQQPNEEEGFLISPEQQGQENSMMSAETKPDPAAEHRVKQDERLSEIAQIEAKNQKLIEDYQKLNGKTRRIMEWFTPRISIQTFEEHNRWTDSWSTITYPLISEDEEEESDKLEQLPEPL